MHICFWCVVQAIPHSKQQCIARVLSNQLSLHLAWHLAAGHCSTRSIAFLKTSSGFCTTTRAETLALWRCISYHFCIPQQSSCCLFISAIILSLCVCNVAFLSQWSSYRFVYACSLTTVRSCTCVFDVPNCIWCVEVDIMSMSLRYMTAGGMWTDWQGEVAERNKFGTWHEGFARHSIRLHHHHHHHDHIINSDHPIAFVFSAIVLSLLYLSDLPTALCSSAIISSLVFIILSAVRMIYKMKSKWYLTAATTTATLIMMVMILWWWWRWYWWWW